MSLIGVFLIGFVIYNCNTEEVPSCTLNPFNPMGMVRPESVVLIDDPTDCVEVAKVQHSKTMWKRQEDDRAVFLEIGILKQIAKRKFDANALSKVVIYDPFQPIGEAIAYRCPPNKIEVLRYRQTDKDFVKSFVKIENSPKNSE